MNSTARRLAMGVVSLAAVLTTGWSLYTVARHYNAPTGIAGAAVAVFDGIAYMCLHLASEAAAEGRSAFGARATALFMAAVSVYLNITHADLIGGGVPAAALFAVPTIGLLAVSEMAWAGPRARVRAERGDQPYRPPAFGGWAWALAPALAGKTVKARAVHHIEHGGAPPVRPEPGRHSAQTVLRRKFAEMDPADAVRIAHDAQPDMPPADLASLLVSYGVVVDAVQVALVLGQRPAEYEVHRPDAPDAPQVNALEPLDLQGAIEEAASALGPDASAREIVERLREQRRLVVTEPYVRTALSRAAKKPPPQPDTTVMRDEGNGGYA
ncbi:hypothetical protein [Streptomyces sp. TRM68416]|uniref:hypothetical protein n=1 Tax=Streptomyces sp. TRM68416 TaxID=2758412 RepID=UPI001661ED4A|nr:hypothetical protein [Streptomyces sp. TRM68416]MBD0838806.1 hypothetical protein [Streptomyces sp. TRM68416]